MARIHCIECITVVASLQNKATMISFHKHHFFFNCVLTDSKKSLFLFLFLRKWLICARKRSHIWQLHVSCACEQNVCNCIRLFPDGNVAVLRATKCYNAEFAKLFSIKINNTSVFLRFYTMLHSSFSGGSFIGCIFT